MAGKALSYLVKLGPIIWWAMPVPALTPLSPAGAPQYSWYPDTGPLLEYAAEEQGFTPAWWYCTGLDPAGSPCLSLAVFRTGDPPSKFPAWQVGADPELLPAVSLIFKESRECLK
ncbi:hypothetical protein DSO57_1025534 [Entomophthora muscae]|uniref:Uncharacterized protein n=1 Tax=Entomophthora muscae TaxID=34485 RepID=A0ACC2TDE2_9FUNG|nr:hypothetical protein DSO57_1025534 [Entomophthora muscae]